jgi:hypothetical protein
MRIESQSTNAGGGCLSAIARTVSHGNLRQCGQVGCQLYCLLDRCSLRNNTIGQPDRQRLFSIDCSASEDQVQRSTQANQPRQAHLPPVVQRHQESGPVAMSRFGIHTLPPSIKGTPHRRQNTPNTAVVSTTRISHHSACLLFRLLV